MSTLDSLIRLHRWQVDERRRQVAELDALAEKLRQELARLAEERTSEQAAAGASFLARHVYPGYLRRAMERQKTLEQSLAETEAQTLAAREALAEAFQELKRYEVAQANRERLRITAAARRERLETDAIAIQTFRRANGR
ncbi:MAG TPA: flagellar FliJ family protein [Stellaceae bacterium]|jgi:flagellar export protein FliJ|nr:flagellar FliJ family protein [Stellaceae bacterium]